MVSTVIASTGSILHAASEPKPHRYNLLLRDIVKNSVFFELEKILPRFVSFAAATWDNSLDLINFQL